jgi:hypothetical protein
MTADRDTERIVRSWLEVGVTALPDHILDTVLDQLPATPQRRSMWPTRRFAQMTTPLKLAIGAAAVLLVALVGYNLLPGTSSSVGGPGPSPTATPVPTPPPTSLTTTDLNRSLAAGTYHVDTDFAAPFALTLPAGWTPFGLHRGETSLSGPLNAKGQQPYFGAFVLHHVSVDPCREDPSASAIPVGSPAQMTAADVVSALGAMPGFQTGPVTNVTVDGQPALRTDLSNTFEPTASGCVGDDLIPIWTTVDGTPVATNPGGVTEHLWIVDQPNGPVILVGEFTEQADQDLATMEAIVASVDFD